MPQMVTDAFGGMAVIAAFVVIGWLISHRFLPRASVFEIAGVALPIGAAALTWGIFLFSWLGIPIGLVSTALLTVSILIGAVWLSRRNAYALSAEHKIALRSANMRWRGRLLRWALIAGWVVLLGVAVIISVGRAHGSWDAASGWVVKGYGIIFEESVYGAGRWGAWGLSYPLNVPIQNGLFSLFGTEELPASKLLYPAYLASLALSVFDFLQRKGVSWAISGTAGLLLLSNPLLFRHGTIGYANLPLAACLIPGIFMSIEGITADTDRRLFIGGMLVAAGIWTRPEGIVYAAAVLGGMIATFVIVGRPLKRLSDLWPWLAPPAVVGGLWLLFGWSNIQSSHLGTAMDGFVPRGLRGELNLYELYLIPRLLLKRALIPETWGVLFPVSTILMVVGARKILTPRANTAEFGLISTFVLVALVPTVLFYVRSYTRSDFAGLLHRSFDRSFIPAAVLLFSASFLLAFGSPNPDGTKRV